MARTYDIYNKYTSYRHFLIKYSKDSWIFKQFYHLLKQIKNIKETGIFCMHLITTINV